MPLTLNQPRLRIPVADITRACHSSRKAPISEGDARLHRGLITLLLERESDAGPDFIDGVTVDRCVAIRRVEREIVIDLPDRANEHRTAFGLIPYLVVEGLEYRTHLPRGRSFQDHANECFGLMVAGEVCFDVEMRRAPVPALRDNASPAESHAGIGIEAGQQRPELGRDADAG